MAPPLKSLQVDLKERSYPVLIGCHLLNAVGRFIKNRNLKQRNVLIVSQREVALYYLQSISDALGKEGFEATSFITPKSKSSEASKSWRVFGQLIRKMAQSDGSYKSLMLIALGGGVVGDLTGFAASVYRRGVPYVQVPTTLTAQVDSAIGGKTALDLAEGKNLLGSIYQPALVVSDITCLESLPQRHWSDGFAEVIKYGVIKDPGLFSMLEAGGLEGIRNDPKRLREAVYRSARIKAGVVSKDELDKKTIRMVLNFGHTTGHAIEAASRFTRQYTHGEAIAIGMLVACDIAGMLGILKNRGLTGRLEKALLKFQLPVYYKGLTVEAILKPMGYDKKSEPGTNRFVLPVDFGKTVIVQDVPQTAIIQALQKRRG